MLDRPSAQILIDGLAAVALGASVFVFAQPQSASPLRPRLAFAFGGLCLFFGARAASAALGSDALSLLSEVVGCALPLAALVLAEGLLRRHAPTPLKALVCGAAVAVAAAVLATDGRPPASDWALGAYVVLSLSAVTVLLLARDRASLSRQENASVDALIVSGAAFTLLSVTDFLPRAPVGLSGVGAAMVAYALSANPSSSREARLALSNLCVICALTAIGVLPFASALGMVSAPEKARLGAIVLAALLAVSAVLDARRRTSRSVRDFALALAETDTTSLNAFLSGLADQPLLAGLRLAEGAQLAEYDQPALGAAMAPRAVWTPAALREAHTPMAPRACDELGDLMARTEATHALLISAAPLRIALLTLPGAGATDDAAADLALFRKLAALAATGPS
jgi:hypothetical protein